MIGCLAVFGHYGLIDGVLGQSAAKDEVVIQALEYPGVDEDFAGHDAVTELNDIRFRLVDDGEGTIWLTARPAD